MFWGLFKTKKSKKRACKKSTKKTAVKKVVKTRAKKVVAVRKLSKKSATRHHKKVKRGGASDKHRK